MKNKSDDPNDRRPLASRKFQFFHQFAALLAKMGISPNTISVLSVVFAAASGITLGATQSQTDTTQRLLWLASAAFVQLRLLCNLMDGLVAVEFGKSSALGGLYNEVPDRIADAVTLILLGFAAGGSPQLGYLAALLAVMTAYVRALGAAMTEVQTFQGPMAKPHRMFAVTVVCLYCAAAPLSLQPTYGDTGLGPAAGVTLIIILGSALTCIRRLSHIASILKEKAV